MMTTISALPLRLTGFMSGFFENRSEYLLLHFFTILFNFFYDV